MDLPCKLKENSICLKFSFSSYHDYNIDVAGTLILKVLHQSASNESIKHVFREK